MIRVCDDCKKTIDYKLKEMEAIKYKQNYLCFHEWIKMKRRNTFSLDMKENNLRNI